jgi:hypothetical protein
VVVTKVAVMMVEAITVAATEAKVVTRVETTKAAVQKADIKEAAPRVDTSHVPKVATNPVLKVAINHAKREVTSPEPKVDTNRVRKAVPMVHPNVMVVPNRVIPARTKATPETKTKTVSRRKNTKLSR